MNRRKVYTVASRFQLESEYEGASQLRPKTLEAMIEQEVDPAARRNAGIVENPLQMPGPKTPEEAKAVVSATVENDVARSMERKSAGPCMRVDYLECAPTI